MSHDPWTTTGRTCLPGRSIPIGFSRGAPFDPASGKGERLRFVSVGAGAGVLSRAGSSVPFRAPAYFCLDEREDARLETSDPASTLLVYFHPSVLRAELSFENVRPPLVSSLPLDAMRDVYWLAPFLERSGPGSGIVLPGLALRRRVEELAARMLAEAESQADGWWPCRTRSFLIEILFSLVTESRAGAGLSAIPDALADGLVRRFFIQVGSRYAERLTVESLARELGTNRTTLQERIAAATGSSVSACISAVRLDAARMLLTDTLLPVAEVAERSGYADTSSFARAFRQRFGLSPSDFREAHGGSLLAR